MGVASLTRAAVFLDRDGVLDRAFVGPDGIARPPADLADFELEAGAGAACARLKEAGLCLVVVTNQPDVARGTQRRAIVEAMNAELIRRLPLDGVLVCYHDDEDHCACRKPDPGMLLDAAQRFALDLGRSVIVGDRWRDIEAGRRAGCATVLVGGHGQDELAVRRLAADHYAASLLDAVDWILARSSTVRQS